MTIKSFFKIFILVDILLILVCLVVENSHWLINSQIAFLTSLAVTSATFLSYRNNVLKGVDNQLIVDDVDLIDKMDDPYDLYSSEINEEIVENPTKEQILEANKPIKQNHFTNLKNSFLSFASFYRIGGYLALIVGFFYLVNNNIFEVVAYLTGFIIVPISVLVASFFKVK
ncbi:MAG: hypothetical protein KAJ49_09825 [Arcobacteraceae bacterium]|nr:hypothetical protein [Arcobacteraceae bacterium]